MKIKACIFDLDGVITDTSEFHFQAWRRLARELGAELSREDNEKLKGVSRTESLKWILDSGQISHKPQQLAEWAERKNVWYLELLEGMGPDDVLPGVEPFIRKLLEMDIRVALGSSSKNARRVLAKLGITGLFDAIVDGTHVDRTKPDPQVFLMGAEKVGVHPSHCVVFEDATSGIEAAKSAGMYAVGVGDENVLSGADLCIATFEGLEPDKFLNAIESRQAHS